MSKVHVVALGDHLLKLGAAEGFADVNVIWNHPRNAELAAARDNFCTLNPGDQIFIPDKQSRSVTVPTGKTHTVVVMQSRIRLSMVIKDMANRPLANTRCELRTEDSVFPLVLDANGQLDQEIPVTSESCLLVFETGQIQLLVGHLVPIDVPDGQRARLDNLGYETRGPEDEDEDDDDDDDDDDEDDPEAPAPDTTGEGDPTADRESSPAEDDLALRSAIEEFQCDHGIAVTGVFDAATRAKLLEVHGS